MKKKKLQAILYNAIILLEDGEYEHNTILGQLGIDEKEYNEIIGE